MLSFLLKTAEKSRKIIGQRAVKLQIVSGDRVLKTEHFCVQALAVQPCQSLFGAIHRVSRHRMANAGKMYADLMRPPRF